jgi:hypothetical protein
MTFRMTLPVLAAGALGCASAWPSVAAAQRRAAIVTAMSTICLMFFQPESALAQCVVVGLDQVCSNSGSIFGPLFR